MCEYIEMLFVRSVNIILLNSLTRRPPGGYQNSAHCLFLPVRRLLALTREYIGQFYSVPDLLLQLPEAWVVGRMQTFPGIFFRPASLT